MTCSHATEIYGKLSQKREMIDRCTLNCMKLRINAGDKSTTPVQDKAIADAYGNKFIIPLDFEMLDSAMPYYQLGLKNRLSYELKFNDYNRVINSSKTDATSNIPNSQDLSGLSMIK